MARSPASRSAHSGLIAAFWRAQSRPVSTSSPGHQELRVLPLQPAAREDRELRAARAEVLAHRLPRTPGRLLLPLLQRTDVGQQPAQQRLVDGVLVAGALCRPADLDLHLLAHLAQLRLEVLPLAHAQVVEELPLAHPPEGAAAELLLLLLHVAPQVQPGQEVGALVLEAGVLQVGLRPQLGRPLARVLQRQRGRDHQHLAHAAEPLGLEDHPAQPRVDRQPGQALADPGQPRVADRQRAELLQQLYAGRHVALVGRLHERERRDVAQPEAGHLQDHAGQVGAQDLRLGELRPRLEVVLGVEPDRDAGLDPPAAAGPLVGRRLADRLDRQPLHLGARRVAGDARDAAVDDVPDAGHGQRRLGDVGGEHDAATRVAGEDPVLLGGRQPGVEGHDLEPVDALQRIGGVPDLPLARQEHQDVARALAAQLLDRVDDRLGLVADDRLALLVGLGEGDQRAVADLDRVGAAGHLDHGRVEVLGEPLHVDRRAGDDQLEVGALRQQPA